MKQVALIAVAMCTAMPHSAQAANARAAERRALAIAEASCVSKGIEHSPNPPHISLKGERWYISWDFVKGADELALAIVDSNSWKGGCTVIGLWHGEPTDLRDTKP